MSYKINEQKRLIIRQKILTGAKRYKKYLMDKDFIVICEDGSIHRLKFFPKDFQFPFLLIFLKKSFRFLFLG